MVPLFENGVPREDVNYKAFLIRIWRSSPESPWRAFAHDTETGDQRHFASLKNLFLFLHDFTTDQPDPDHLKKGQNEADSAIVLTKQEK